MADLSFEAAIEFARALIRIPGAPGNEGDVARRVMAEMKALGFHDVRSDDAGNVIGRAPGRGEKPAVMLNSHMDVVDVGDEDTWEHPPYAAHLDDAFLHGRGAMDIKGPLALQTYAAAHFLERPGPGDVIVAVNGARITSQTDLVQLQSSMVAGARLSLMVERGAETVPIALNFAGS